MCENGAMAVSPLQAEKVDKIRFANSAIATAP
jgi:hypothetical protein